MRRRPTWRRAQYRGERRYAGGDEDGQPGRDHDADRVGPGTFFMEAPRAALGHGDGRCSDQCGQAIFAGVATDVPSTRPAGPSACTSTIRAALHGTRIVVSKPERANDATGCSEWRSAPASTCQRATFVAPFQLAATVIVVR